MVKVAWATDVHLNWIAEERKREEWIRSILKGSPDAVVLTGDIADGPETAGYLRYLEAELRRPIYFVLGNHDFYGRSVREARREAEQLAAESEFLVYLTASEIVQLTPDTAIIGHDGWGDARLGDYRNSRVWLADFVAIKDLQQVHSNRDAMRERLHELGDEAARHIADVLPKTLSQYTRVVLATHVPPYRESAWYDGRFSDDDWLPFFSCKVVGDVLRDVMQRRPDRQLLVLCGHTHGSGEAQILDNLRVLTGGSGYDGPAPCRILEFG